MPSIAAGILKTGLLQADIPCRVFYANILLAATIGLREFVRIASRNFYNRQDLICERIFAASAHDSMGETKLNIADAPHFLREFNDLIDETNDTLTELEYAGLEAECAKFIRQAAVEIASLQPRVVGFSCSMQQINASIALAREIKKILPGVICVIGGKNCDGVMGEEMASSVMPFDFVFQGEADFTFPSFCGAYLNDNVLPVEKLIRCALPINLDEVPFPDHSDYIEQSLPELKQFSTLTFESSRGCWWGQHNRCKFCADTGASIAYRSKSPARLLSQLCLLQEKYPDFNNYAATDSIFPHTYFRDFFQKLSESGFKGDIAYEVKANLTFDQLTSLKKGRISTIDPGIESLSTRLLKLMNKGCTASSNIRLLRDCRELGISPLWHMLICIPGDRVSDYEDQIRLMRLIRHLHPPTLSPITIQRFSSYFEDPETYGLTDIRPVIGYEHAFPETVDISRLAYYFDAEFPSEGRENPWIIDSLVKELCKWFKSWQETRPPGLWLRHTGDDQWTIEDTRGCASKRTASINKEGYSLLRKYRIASYRQHSEENDLTGGLLDRGYLIEVDGKLLSVVCEPVVQ